MGRPTQQNWILSPIYHNCPLTVIQTISCDLIVLSNVPTNMTKLERNEC